MKIRDTELKIEQGDITELKVDAIVNAANNRLVMGGGVASFGLGAMGTPSVEESGEEV